MSDSSPVGINKVNETMASAILNKGELKWQKVDHNSDGRLIGTFITSFIKWYYAGQCRCNQLLRKSIYDISDIVATVPNNQCDETPKFFNKLMKKKTLNLKVSFKNVNI